MRTILQHASGACPCNRQMHEIPGNSQKRGGDQDRDISEHVTLGQAGQPTLHEAHRNARLFNQPAALASGIHGGSDEKNIVYDKRVFADRSHEGTHASTERGSRKLRVSCPHWYKVFLLDR